MPSPFDAIDVATQATIDGIFGEGIRIRPQVGDDYSGGNDPDRPVREGVRATVAISHMAPPTDYSGSLRNGAALVTFASEIWIDATAYAALGFELKRGDWIELTDPKRGSPPPRHIVASVHPGDNGDVQVLLG